MSDTALVPLHTDQSGGLSVSHVIDANRRYPGETLRLLTRVEVLTALPGFRLQVSLPDGLHSGLARAHFGDGALLPYIASCGRRTNVVWEVEPARAGERYDFSLEAEVEPTSNDVRLETRAVASSLPGTSQNGSTSYRAEETATVVVSPKSSLLKYLPALYQEDDLMGRFLMLFESFWSPIVKQIDHMSVYFDPNLTQPELLPWLASWVGLALDERWPEERRRRLLGAGVSLFRRRGTKKGLQDYLEIYTGRKPRIIEHGANNFRIGKEARLGKAIAFGTGNRPHTFSVKLSLPLVEGATEDERARKEAERRKIVASIIESEKPAHTEYDLNIEVES